PAPPHAVGARRPRRARGGGCARGRRRAGARGGALVLVACRRGATRRRGPPRTARARVGLPAVIREVRPEDAAAVVALTRRTRPFLPVSEESVLYRRTSEPPEAAAREWVADGAYAYARRVWERLPAGSGGLGVVVDPDYRRRGLGTALYETALAYLEE